MLIYTNNTFQEYIIALCQPESVKQFSIKDCKSDIEVETIEQIEKQTNAVLWKVDENTIEIRGSDLAVILAMSSLETMMIKCKQTALDLEEDGVMKTPEKQKLNVDLANSIWAKELDSRLLRVLSSQSQSENSVSIDDYNKTSPSVKMTILKCMNDIDDISDHDLFQSASSEDNPSYHVPVFMEGKQLNRDLFPSGHEGNKEASNTVTDGPGTYGG